MLRLTLLYHSESWNCKKTKKQNAIHWKDYSTEWHTKTESEGKKLREELTDIQKRAPWDRFKEAISPF